MFWDCPPVLSLTAFWLLIDFCHKGALSCLIDTGSYSSREIASAMKLGNFDIDNLGLIFSSRNLNWYIQSKVKPRTSHMRFLFVVSKHLQVGPLVSLWTFNRFRLWLVIHFGDTVVALRNRRVLTKECNWPVPVKKWINLVCMLHQY